MKGKKHFSFGVPIVWQEPQNHLSDCYFKTTGLTSKTVFPNPSPRTHLSPRKDLMSPRAHQEVSK